MNNDDDDDENNNYKKENFKRFKDCFTVFERRYKIGWMV